MSQVPKLRYLHFIIILLLPSTPTFSHWPYIHFDPRFPLFPHSRWPSLATLYVLSLESVLVQTLFLEHSHAFLRLYTLSLRVFQTLVLLWNTLTRFSDFTPSHWECFRHSFSSGSLSRVSQTLHPLSESVLVQTLSLFWNTLTRFSDFTLCWLFW